MSDETVAQPSLPEEVSEAAEEIVSAHPAQDLLASDLIEAPAAGEEFPAADEELARDEELAEAAADELDAEEGSAATDAPAGDVPSGEAALEAGPQ
ncbi:MAG TPA: hypothetical protein VFF55_00755, partial [Candidatus Deferrimicrobium sp.]|nr:hypothetical protein [Candidatus Deferrimicrobium sp.]